MNHIRKIVVAHLFVAVITTVGCATSGSVSAPAAKTTSQFQFDAVDFNFEQFATPEISYHEPAELEAMLNNEIEKLLAENDLLSDEPTMNKLDVKAYYRRRFVGDATPLTTDSLAYPNFAYSITVMDGPEKIASIERNNLTYGGGFAMNMQVIAGTLRDKKYEVEFIEALARTIVASIEEVRNP